jgi:hypothetical protein
VLLSDQGTIIVSNRLSDAILLDILRAQLSNRITETTRMYATVDNMNTLSSQTLIGGQLTSVGGGGTSRG